ncbi:MULTISPECIES: DUF7859 family protein [Halalkalicoccus]
MLIELNPVYVVFMGVLLIFIVGSYLFVRKVLLGFRQGFEGGRR